jgi:myo-inositol-1(or 4)-monophosphatase
MTQFTPVELDEIYAFAVDLGKRAGKILLDGIEKRVGGVGGSGELAFTEKDNAVDIVTQTDEGALNIPFF